MKKRRITPAVCVVLMLISAFISFQITYTHLTGKYESTIYGFNKWSDFTSNLDDIEDIAGDGTGTKWQEVYKILAETDAVARASYVNDIDDSKLLEWVMTGYVHGLEDKYAAYMTRSEYEAYMLSSKQGAMVGIGVRITYDNTLGGIYITSVMLGSPAEKAGIKPGDVIVGVDGKDVNEEGYYNSYNKIKQGKEGEPVVLTVALAVSDYTEFSEISVVRSTMETDTVSSRMIEKDVAYVSILEFDSTTGDEFKKEMDARIAEGAKKFVFDVRNNPGGNVYGVSTVLDYLLPEGPIIRTVSKSGQEGVLSSDAKCVKAPMVVLVNGNTASGGELFTAALRDYKMATVIGTKTYGKGTMQSIIPLSDGSAIKLSTQMYNPPYGENYEGKGIVPDKTVELSAEAAANFYRISDQEDAQLMSALDELRNK